MVRLESFYDLISRNAQVTLVNERDRTTCFIGSARDIPDEYSGCEVADFTMDDNGHLTFRIKVREKRPAGRNWDEGAIRVHDSIFHYWVKHYEEGSQYGIGGGKISKLMLKRNGEIVCNYDRGWDVEPVDADTELAKDIILHQFSM